MSFLPHATLSSVLLAATLLCSTATKAQSTDFSIGTEQEPLARPDDGTSPDDGLAKSGEQSFAINGGVFSIFPVPASNRLTVRYTAAKTGDLTLQLMNTQGHPVLPVMHVAVTEREERKFYMNVSNLADGTYIMRAIQSSSVLARQVIVAH